MGSLVAELAEKLSSATNSLDFDEQTLYINTSTNRVAIGTNAPVTDLTIEGPITIKEQADADADTAAYGQIWVNTATPNELYFTTDAGDDIALTSGTAVAGGFDADAAQVFNESGADADFRIEGDAQTHLFFLDAGNDRIGINTSSPAVGLDIRTPVNVGLDGTGHDVIFYGDTAGRKMTWDESEDRMVFTDDVQLRFGTGSDMQFYHDGSNSYITNATGALKLATETSGIAVTIGHTTSETTVADNLTVTGEIISALGAGNSTVSRTGQSCRMYLDSSYAGASSSTFVNNWALAYNDDSSLYTPTTSGPVEGIKILRAGTYLMEWSSYINVTSTNGYLQAYLSKGGDTLISESYNIQYVVGANTWNKFMSAQVIVWAQNDIIGQKNNVQAGTYTVSGGSGDQTWIQATYLHD